MKKVIKWTVFFSVLEVRISVLEVEMNQDKSSTRIEIPGVSVSRSGHLKEVSQASRKELYRQYH